MNSRAARGWMLLALMLAAAYGGWVAYHLPAAETPEPEARPRPISDFLLTDQTGEPFGTRDLHGQVWVASFFFASCPGTCRQLNFSLAEVAKEVPDDVRFVSITCDPDNDDPATLARYGELFAADPQRWKFLTGPMKDLQRVGHDIFQVALEKQTHTEKAFVVDRQGRLRGRFKVLDPDERAKLTALVTQFDREK